MCRSRGLSFCCSFIISYFILHATRVQTVCCLSASFYSVVKQIKVAENIIIKDLLGNPFSIRPLYDKLTIVK